MSEFDNKDWKRLDFNDTMVNAIKDKLHRTYNSATGTYNDSINVNASKQESNIYIHKREKVPKTKANALDDIFSRNTNDNAKTKSKNNTNK